MEKYGKQKRYAHEHVDFLPYDKNNPAKKFKPKHAKPYRKRHLLALTALTILFSISIFSLGVVVVRGVYQRSQANKASLEAQNASQVITLNSTLGYHFNFDRSQFTVESTVDNKDGSRTNYSGTELIVPRAYNFTQLTPLYDSVGRSVRYDSSEMSVMLESADITQDTDLVGIARSYGEAGSQDFDVVLIEQTTEVIGDQEFAKITYQKTPKFTSAATATSSKTIVYAANDYGHPLIIKIAGISDDFTPMDVYKQVVDSVVLENPRAEVLGASYLRPDIFSSWLDPLKNWLRDFIGDNQTPQEKQAKLVAANTPAVVKLYHVVCGELIINNSSLGYDCLTTTGSGFFVSSDGYIFTSGHVVSVSAKDVIVETIRSNPSTLPTVLELLGYSSTEVNQTVDAAQKDPAALLSVLQQIYKLPDDAMHFNGQRDLYGATLGNEPISFINEQDKPNLAIKETDSVKNASVVAVDYNSADLVNDTFTGSDVAILKVQGNNYPVVHLGSIDILTQGVPVTVLGYPAIADNELTDNNIIKATATDGVISAVRNSNDGQHKIIQSDVVISGGNSGGPAFNENGEVFGIATYVYQSNDGGVLSYMRDIGDALKLAQASGVNLNTKSTTQSLWEAGIDDFYAAHYASATKKFQQVKQAYPAHALADDYIRISEARIASGGEARSQSIVYGLVVVMIASLTGMGVMVVIIIRHNRHHHQYKILHPSSTH